MDLWVIFGSLFGFKDSISAPFYLYLRYMKVVVNTILSPINNFLDTMFPDLSGIIEMFDNFLSNYIAPFINYFFHLLPPNAMNVLLIYISVLGIFYVITIGTHIIIKVFEIIKNLKFW